MRSNGSFPHAGPGPSDPYSVLGVTSEATEAEIRAAWRELLKSGAHPDTADQADEADVAVRTRITGEINLAYQALLARRKEIDRIGSSGATTLPTQSTVASSTGADHPHHHDDRLRTLAGLVAFLRLDRRGQWIAATALTLVGIPLGVEAEPYAVGDLVIWAGTVAVIQVALAGRVEHTPFGDIGRVIATVARLRPSLRV